MALMDADGDAAGYPSNYDDSTDTSTDTSTDVNWSAIDWDSSITHERNATGDEDDGSDITSGLGSDTDPGDIDDYESDGWTENTETPTDSGTSDAAQNILNNQDGAPQNEPADQSQNESESPSPPTIAGVELDTKTSAVLIVLLLTVAKARGN